MIHRGHDAWELLADDRFLRHWQGLYESCSWATAYQSPAFIGTWYDSYRSKYSPVLVVEQRDDQSPIGLLCLAESVDGGRLVVAGAHQAEYHAWITEAAGASQFMAKALPEIARAFPRRGLEFQFIPGGFPVDALHALRSRFPRMEMKTRPRPLMRIDKAELDESFRKKSNKSRFNRMKALGRFEFKRLTTVAELDPIFDEIIELYDIRQGGAHGGVLPFGHDSIKKPFHRALLARDPALVHLTVTTIDDRPVAVHFGIADKEQVHLAIIAYSPLYARHSPAKLHLMLLGNEFVREGVKVLDLTPGDDPWKERFANAHDDVHAIVFHGSSLSQAAGAARGRLGSLARSAAKRLDVTPEAVRDFASRVSRVRPLSIARRVRRLIRERAELRVYRRAISTPVEREPDARIRRDSLADLLKFHPTASRPSREQFLAESLDRLERGEHVYTHATETRLLHSGWLVENQNESLLSEVGLTFSYPAGSAVLYDFYSDVEARGRGLYQSSLAMMLADIASIPGAQYVYIVVLADNAPSRHVIEKLGFEYQASLFRTRLLGRTRQWGEPPLPTIDADPPQPPETSNDVSRG